MYERIRKMPPVCLCVAIIKLMVGSLKISKEHVGAELVNRDGNVFRIFRNLLSRKETSSPETAVLIVSFKFARLSHQANKVASFIPMLLIAGLPGFVQKMYAVYEDSGYWQGIYEWKSKQHLDDYKKSFVFKMTNKRAISNTIRMEEFEEL